MKNEPTRLNITFCISNVLLLFVTLTSLSSCGIESSSRARIDIINLSSNNKYIGIIDNCDSCEIIRDVNLYSWSEEKENIPQDMRLLKAKDSLYLLDKYLPDTTKIFAIDADSLTKYFNTDMKFLIHKPWIKIVLGKSDQKSETCRIVIQ